MDFDDLVTAEPPPNRAGRAKGAHEHHLYEGAVMVGSGLRRFALCLSTPNGRVQWLAVSRIATATRRGCRL
ncbi:hypothetical protein CN160_35255 [Sinorhizobium meliloti]|nr:hypothetical protein CDO29_17410 [Sinorhizobium meliloti]RVK38673.1 hypothetical protein CN160_35255 [Sinorhizobium meliloti]